MSSRPLPPSEPVPEAVKNSGNGGGLFVGDSPKSDPPPAPLPCGHTPIPASHSGLVPPPPRPKTHTHTHTQTLHREHAPPAAQRALKNADWVTLGAPETPDPVLRPPPPPPRVVCGGEHTLTLTGLCITGVRITEKGHHEALRTKLSFSVPDATRGEAVTRSMGFVQRPGKAASSPPSPSSAYSSVSLCALLCASVCLCVCVRARRSACLGRGAGR